MEILRPQNVNGLFEKTLKGKIRITTRCLWLDKGRLLDALHTAARAALSSCPVNCPLTHMERTVSEVLRKLVRKYSGKRPEVIAIAMENPTAVISDEVRARLSGKSHVGFEMSGLRKVVDGRPNKSRSNRRHEDGGKQNTYIENDSQDLEGKSIELEGILHEEEISTSRFNSDTISSDSEESEFLKSFGTALPVDEVVKENNGSITSQEHIPELEEGKEGVEMPASKPKKPVKRDKWKPAEVLKLIKLRGELHSQFQVVKQRMALWEEISGELVADGFNRSPGQCKSRWASLVQEYEESKSGKKTHKNWSYFEEMNKVLSDSEAVGAK